MSLLGARQSQDKKKGARYQKQYYRKLNQPNGQLS